ncbi:MAG: hypothetical protein DRJ97_08345 [Thermoprotei archaeon]|nr:MAG: hypothetical protein DRJ97_08345 [Thermoprotei archaeon]
MDVRSAILDRLRRRIKEEVKHLLTIPIIFSLGSGAGRVLAKINVSKIGAIKVAMNSSKRDLIQIDEEVDVPILCGDGGGSGMRPEKGREDYLEVAEGVPFIIEKACEAYGCDEPDVIVTIASVGHGFGSGSLPEHVKVVKESYPNAAQLVFVITPFYFEGETPLVRAYTSLKEAVKHTTVFPLSNQIASLKLGIDPQRIKLDDVLYVINARIAEVLDALFESLTASEGVRMGMDRSDLKNMMQGELGAIGMVKYPSLAGLTVDRVLQDLASSIYARLAVRSEGAYGTYIIDSCEEGPLALLNELSRQLVLKWAFRTQFLKPLIIERDRPGVTILTIMTNILLSKHVESELHSLVFGMQAGEYWTKSLAKKLKGLFFKR